ncbi:MAG: patatin-like phospholipase family protein, partial [Calditrichota bacterium]
MQHSGKSTFLIFLSLILIIFSSAIAQKRPTVGVALSGGSAKGIAHIGVLKVLEEINMPIDYVTGTSMGSIVGGLYSVGYTADELESIVTEIDWPAIFAEETSRDVLTLEQKKRDARYTFNLALENWGISIPAGIVAGHKVTQLLTRLTLPVQHLESFSQYPIPFACVATDIATGEAVVIKDGSLAEAMRASMAIPSAFTPVERDGKLLVDGLLVRNFPVQDARSLGADIVIGVDVGAELYEAEELTNLFTMLDQVLNLQMIGSTELERDMTDFLLIPELGDLGFADFTKTAEFIAKGEEVARSMLPELQALADSLNTLDPWQRTPRPATPQKFKISEITFEGLTSVSEKLMIAQFPYILPATLAVEDIEQFVDQVYRNQVFERVNYRLANAESGEGARLIIHAIERSQSLLQLGARYNSGNDASLLVNTTFFIIYIDASTLSMDL